jgi:hypothetical protein
MSSGQPASAVTAKPAKKVSPGTIVALCVLAAVVLGMLALTARSQATDRDFVSYWAGARLLVTHGNPYDAHAVLLLENGIGNKFVRPLVLRNTPCTIFLMAPLGWFDFYNASMLWEALLILASLVSIWLLQPFVQGKVPILAYFFAPIVDCILAGQTTILVLLGVCLFIRLEQQRPFRAGAALLLTLLKPHLLALFWPVLLLDILRRREWRLVAGGVCATAVASAIGTLIDPRIWTQYLVSVRAEHIENQYFPNIACTLRILISPHSLWPQLLPAIAGIVIALWIWARTRGQWEWSREGAMLFAGSALVAPYSFLVDQVLFLPAVLFCYPRASRFARTVFIAVNVAAFYLMLKVPAMSSPVTLWVAPAMMIWCYHVYRRRGPASAPDTPGAAVAAS